VAAPAIQRVGHSVVGPQPSIALPLVRATAPEPKREDLQRLEEPARSLPTALDAGLIAVQRASGEPSDGDTSGPALSPAGAMIQRAPSDSAGGTPEPGAGGSTAATPAASERDLDELARRLYDRIRLRLSRELLVDRERAGALTDHR
jgi:hypothetical protein